jgi:hypothetical protein
MRFVTYRHLARMAAAGVIVVGVSALAGLRRTEEGRGAAGSAEDGGAGRAARSPPSRPRPARARSSSAG